MRFVFVDRIVSLEIPQRIETVTDTVGLDDVFAEHFPGYPVMPGALIVEAFAQASQLLIAWSRELAEVGRLRRLSRVAFRHQVRPGDRLEIRCERRAGDDRWVLDATAVVASRRVAAATLEYDLEPATPGTAAARAAERLAALGRELRPVTLGVAARDHRG
jgi:3-hydroxymyristoyl/3-hydroxydecanoyl-(acyl carrier protein) dehydratase